MNCNIINVIRVKCIIADITNVSINAVINAYNNIYDYIEYNEVHDIISMGTTLGVFSYDNDRINCIKGNYKTQLCNKYPDCTYGINCAFIHGYEELREVHREIPIAHRRPMLNDTKEKVNNISNHIIKMEEKLDKIVDKFDNKAFIEFIENIQNLNITEKEIPKKFPELCWYIS